VKIQQLFAMAILAGFAIARAMDFNFFMKQKNVVRARVSALWICTLILALLSLWSTDLLRLYFGKHIRESTYIMLILISLCLLVCAGWYEQRNMKGKQ
jgi:hypothetical protein